VDATGDGDMELERTEAERPLEDNE